MSAELRASRTFELIATDVLYVVVTRCSIKGRRKEKECSPCVIADHLHDNGNSYLDDELTQECIVDVDLSALVFRPIGVEYNEWLATHSELLLLFLFYIALSDHSLANRGKFCQTWKLMELLMLKF